MKANVDPRLIEQIARAGDDGEVEALVLLTNEPGRGAPAEATRASSDARGDQLIRRVSERINASPTQVRHFPRLGAVYIRGSGRLIRDLLEEDEVASASSGDAEADTAS